MTHDKNSRSPNGHAGAYGRVNGNADRSAVHAHDGCQPASGPASASAERDGPPVHLAHAASDDACGATVASAALTAAAGADRQEYAEVAPSRPNGAASRAPRNPKSRSNGSVAGAGDKPIEGSSKASSDRKIPPGKSPLPTDPAEFVQEIHRKIDLTKVWHSLLRSRDVKIKQRAAERLTDMFYKGAATSGEEAQQIIVDLEKPAPRHAAEGEKQ